MRSKATMRWAPTWAPTWMPESAYPRRWKIEDSGPPVGRVLARRGRPSFPLDSANLWRSGLRSQIADSAGREAIGRLNAQRGIKLALLQHRCQRPKWPMCLSLWTRSWTMTKLMSRSCRLRPGLMMCLRRTFPRTSWRVSENHHLLGQSVFLKG